MGNSTKIDFNDSLLLSNTNEDAFWSKEQLVFLNQVPRNAFVIMGLIVSTIGIVGLADNGTVLFIFSRFKRLRSPPANTFIINLALSDMAASALHSMASYSNFNGRWAFGSLGCKLYAMGITCFGLVSILTFSAIACERCLVISLTDSHWKASRFQAKTVCGFIWLHCTILVSLPIFGWSSYVPEGLLTTCSWDYKTRTISNRAYYILLLTAGFFLPVLLIFISYGRILTTVLSQARQLVCTNSHNSVLLKLRRQTEIRTAQIVVTLIIIYLTAWTPYSVVTLIGQFGPHDSPPSPLATAITAYFAKTAVLIDPLVFSFCHPHFRNSLKNYLLNFCFSRHVEIGSDIRPHPSGGISKCSSKSWPGGLPSGHHSRGMTVYPTAACCALRICDPQTCTRFLSSNNVANNAGNTNRRNGRMLRTFRELSLNDVAQTSFSANNRAVGAANGRAGGTSGTTRTSRHQAHSNVRYKVRNAEFYSEIIGFSGVSVDAFGGNHQPA
ncbi:melanopsin-like [Daphnia carinata]|uniref:melanopsin-like n=1 Tax=Daphnia carinata TaxID=120202 RepID=UPI00286949FA|nr:melanopsin-like [Daphnia carinata]